MIYYFSAKYFPAHKKQAALREIYNFVHIEEESLVTPTMRLYLPRVEARLRGITALWFCRKKGHLHTIPCNEQEWDKELAYNRHFTQYINIIIHHPKYEHIDRLRSKSR